MNGPSTNFHFSRLFKGDTQAVSIARHEHYLFSRLDLRPGMRILEVGCGVGSAVLELANFADVCIVGIDPDARKIEKAKQTSSKQNLSDRVTFVKSDYSNLCSVFEESSFDGIYCIESLKCSSSFGSIYNDLCHLLRPGCKFAVYEWCWTQEMNPDDINHRLFAELLESSTGIGNRPISERSYEAAVGALQTSQIQILHQEDLSDSSSLAMIPWYTFLDSAFSDATTCWPSTNGEQGYFGGLTKNAAVILSQAGHLQLFTPMAFFVAMRKISSDI